MEVREGYVQNLREAHKKPSLQQLKAILGMQERKIQQGTYSFSALPGGLAKSGVSEISGEGKTEWCLSFLQEQSDLRVAWVEREWTVYLEAFPRHGVELERALFVESENDFDWASLQLIRNQVFDVVVLSGDQRYSDRLLRRIQIESERSTVTSLLLSSQPIKRGRNFLKRQVQCHHLGMESGVTRLDLETRLQCAL